MELPKYIYNKETNETYECLGMHWTEKILGYLNIKQSEKENYFNLNFY